MGRFGREVVAVVLAALLQIMVTPAGYATDSILSLKFIPPGNGKPMLLDLGSHTCVPCKQMQPILAELKKEYFNKITVQVVDVYERQDLAKQYKIYVIPTQIFFDAKGKELDRHVGFFAKADIVAKFRALGML